MFFSLLSNFKALNNPLSVYISLKWERNELNDNGSTDFKILGSGITSEDPHIIQSEYLVSQEQKVYDSIGPHFSKSYSTFEKLMDGSYKINCLFWNATFDFESF